MAAKKQKAYFGLSYIVSLILTIIPITDFIFGIIKRIQDGCIIAAILRLLLGWNIIWILDIVFMILKKDIFCLLNC